MGTKDPGYWAARYAANRVANIARVQAYYAIHAEEIKSRRRARYAANADVERAQARERQRAFRTAHPDQAKARDAANQAAHGDKYRARHNARRAANPGPSREAARAWQKAHPDRVRANVNRRRARLLGASGSHTEAEWQAICAEFHQRCAYCGARRPLSRDHVIPLIRGGSDAIENVVPACLSCNSAKGPRSLADWLGLAA
jgi:5-methylcytosine-specific restriction endonuclease McrA